MCFIIKLTTFTSLSIFTQYRVLIQLGPCKKYRGEVQRGARRGTELGYPTINLPLKDSTISGIYSALVYLNDEEAHKAAVFADPVRGVIEAHILDFQDDLYGLYVTIELHKNMRDSKQFDNDNELKNAIEKDIEDVRKYFIDD